jgi:branched-chain amino acid transport system ATP-binding protein
VAERARSRRGRLWRDLLNLAAPSADELDRVAEVLDLVGLAEAAERPAAALDLGSCRLVELARAVVGRPRVLLADEPSSGLDAQETEEVGRTLRRLQAEWGMAVVLVEHDLAMVEAVVDRVVVLDLGRVLAEGTFAEVMGAPVVRRAYLGTP